MLGLKEVLTDSYSKAIHRHFDNIFDSLDEDEKNSAENYENELISQMNQFYNEKNRVILEWANTFVEELNNTPAALIDSMEELKDVFDLFIYMAEHADDEVPFIVIEKLKNFEAEAVSALSKLANSRLENHDTDMVFIEAVSALGKLKLTDAVRTLIDLAYKVNDESSGLDYIEEALKNAGDCTIEPILEVLEGKEMGNVEKMLLYVLAFAGAGCKDDRIYKILRQAFRTMEDKMTAVICFNAYGDGRAIPMLRGYLERNDKIEKNLYFEIVGTIRNLGGKTDDFLKPF